jgi:hypothetical protein
VTKALTDLADKALDICRLLNAAGYPIVRRRMVYGPASLWSSGPPC